MKLLFPLLIIVIVAFVTALIILSIKRISSQATAQKILQYGHEREYFIFEMLCTAFSKKTVMKNLFFPIPLKNGKGYTEVDIVVVNHGGIAVIEVKGSKGLIENPPTGQWCQRYGQKTIHFQNPYEQNEGHIKALLQVLKRAGIVKVPIRNLTVYTDNNVRFTHNYKWLLKSKEIVAYLDKMDGKLLLTGREIKKIASILSKYKKHRKIKHHK